MKIEEKKRFSFLKKKKFNTKMKSFPHQILFPVKINFHEKRCLK